MVPILNFAPVTSGQELDFGAKVPILNPLYLTRKGGCTSFLKKFIPLTSGREFAFPNPFVNSNELFPF